MRGSARAKDPPLAALRRWGLAIGAIVVWPLYLAPSLLRARKFSLLARRAAHWRHHVTDEGIIAQLETREDLISWEALAEGRWFVCRVPSLASGFEETYGIEVPSDGFCFVGNGLELEHMLSALRDRGLEPTLRDGGQQLGAVGWLLTIAWFCAAAAIAVGSWLT